MPSCSQELASAAEQDRAWGEAVRTVRRLVEVDPSAESKLELARLERKTGHRARALELVRSVLNDNPDSPEAHAMLEPIGRRRARSPAKVARIGSGGALRRRSSRSWLFG